MLRAFLRFLLLVALGLVVLGGPVAPMVGQATAGAQSEDLLPGDRTNNRTKWVLLGVGGVALVGLGLGLMRWKGRLESQDGTTAPAAPPADLTPTQPPAGPTPLASSAQAPSQAMPASPPVGTTPLLSTSGPAQTAATTPPVADRTPLPPSPPRNALQTGTPPLAPDPNQTPAIRPEDAIEEPVWDDRQGCYVQFDPTANNWLVFDQVTQAWRVK